MQLLFSQQESVGRHLLTLTHQVIPITCADKYCALQSGHRVAAVTKHAAVIGRLEAFRGEQQAQATGVHSVGELVQAIAAVEEVWARSEESWASVCARCKMPREQYVRRIDVDEDGAHHSGGQLHDQPLDTGINLCQ